MTTEVKPVKKTKPVFKEVDLQVGNFYWDMARKTKVKLVDSRKINMTTDQVSEVKDKSGRRIFTPISGDHVCVSIRDYETGTVQNVYTPVKSLRDFVKKEAATTPAKKGKKNA